MEFTQDTLIGLAILLAIAIVIAILVLRPGKRERIELTRDEEEPRRTLSPLPKAPPPIEVPAPPAVASPAEGDDDLTRLKGLGPKAAALLTGLGVTRYAQIAAWSDDDVARVDGQLGAFKGRIARDRWVEQARLLSAGDTTAYEAEFGKLS